MTPEMIKDVKQAKANDQQKVLGKTFKKILEKAGCQNPHTKIHYSGIPLR